MPTALLCWYIPFLFSNIRQVIYWVDCKLLSRVPPDTNFHCTKNEVFRSSKDFFSICGQIRRKLRIWSHLLKKFLMENFIFWAVFWILSKISDVTFLGKQLIAFSCLDMFLKMFVLKIFQKTFSMVIDCD